MCAKDLKDIAAMWLEELNISGDTMIDMNHDLENLDPNLRGSYNLFDLLDLFVDHVREGEELKKDTEQVLILPVVSERFLKSLVVENIVKSYGVDLMLVKELAAEIRKL